MEGTKRGHIGSHATLAYSPKGQNHWVQAKSSPSTNFSFKKRYAWSVALTGERIHPFLFFLI
jgi:hypothetical protein